MLPTCRFAALLQMPDPSRVSRSAEPALRHSTSSITWSPKQAEASAGATPSSVLTRSMSRSPAARGAASSSPLSRWASAAPAQLKLDSSECKRVQGPSRNLATPSHMQCLAGGSLQCSSCLRSAWLSPVVFHCAVQGFAYSASMRSTQGRCRQLLSASLPPCPPNPPCSHHVPRGGCSACALSPWPEASSSPLHPLPPHLVFPVSNVPCAILAASFPSFPACQVPAAAHCAGTAALRPGQGQVHLGPALCSGMGAR